MKVYELVIRITTIILALFLVGSVAGGILWANTLDNSFTPGLLALSTAIWLGTIGVFILPAFGLGVALPKLVLKRGRSVWGIALATIAGLLLLTPFSYQPGFAVEENAESYQATRITKSLVPTLSITERARQHARWVFENGCHIDLLSWSEDSSQLLFRVNGGNCDLKVGMHTWTRENGALSTGNPYDLMNGTPAPWIRDNTAAADIRSHLSDLLDDPEFGATRREGVALIDALPAPDGTSFAVTLGDIFAEELYVVDTAR